MTDKDPEVQMDREQEKSEVGEKINLRNALNTFAFIVNTIVVFTIGSGGAGGGQSNSEVSAKYATLITPAGWAFSIWVPIFVLQGVFTVVQLLPRIRAVPMVQVGVGYFYVAVCLFQVGWTVVFSYEIIWASLLFMILVWTSLVCLVTSQYYTEREKNHVEFWFLRFPFALHCGWITAATAINVNLLYVSKQASSAVQLSAAIVSIAILFAVSLLVLYVPERPNYTISAVLSWATGAVASELKSPSDSLQVRFSGDVIEGTKIAAAAVSVIILISTLVRTLLHVRRSNFSTRAANAFRASLARKPSRPGLGSKKESMFGSGF